MAGSYDHVVTRDGVLCDVELIVSMLDNGGDVFETVEAMYGMIWYLANELKRADVYGNPKDAIEEARVFYKEGLRVSPSIQYIKE